MGCIPSAHTPLRLQALSDRARVQLHGCLTSATSCRYCSKLRYSERVPSRPQQRRSASSAAGGMRSCPMSSGSSSACVEPGKSERSAEAEA